MVVILFSMGEINTRKCFLDLRGCFRRGAMKARSAPTCSVGSAIPCSADRGLRRKARALRMLCLLPDHHEVSCSALPHPSCRGGLTPVVQQDKSSLSCFFHDCVTTVKLTMVRLKLLSPRHPLSRRGILSLSMSCGFPLLPRVR